MKKVIITGVTGMDGSLMADYLLNNTDYLIIAGARRLSVCNHKNINHLKNNPRFIIVDLDITDSQNIESVIREHTPDYFINFAANSFVGNSWHMPTNHMQGNCIAVLHQLEAIRKFAPNCRYYNAGSSEEFGDVVYSPQDESHPLRPRSPYGASKASARHLVKVYRDSYNLFAIQGWLFNHEGVRRGEEFVTRKITKNVIRIAESIKNKEKFEPLELGNLESKRDWSDAEDFVEGVWLMLNQDEPKEYVLSSNETHTIKEFVELAFKEVGIDGIWVGTNLNEMYQLPNYLSDFSELYSTQLVKINPKFYRPAEVELLWGDSTKARSELNWNPKTDFKGLVKKMLDNDLEELKMGRG
jgi:GDPmannose 4,6-dehydratase